MPTKKPNRVMGEASLEIAGEERILDFTFDTFEQIGQQLGTKGFVETVRKISADLTGDVNFDTIWIILTEAMRAHWPDVERSALTKALRPRDMPKIVGAIETAFQAALPEDEGGSAADPPKTAAA